MRKIFHILLSALTFISMNSLAQNPNANQNKFRQLDYELPTPNVYRTASGAPGHAYWQISPSYAVGLRCNHALLGTARGFI